MKVIIIGGGWAGVSAGIKPEPSGRFPEGSWLVKKARLRRFFSPETVGTVCAEGANSPPDRVLRMAKPYGAICRPQVSRSIRIQSEGL